MPIRPSIRPYIPRLGYRAYQAPSYGSEFQGGWDIGSALLQGIANIRRQNRLDAIANALLNQANPPRAALVDPRGGALKVIPGVNAPAGTDPNAPVPTTGTGPATGGLAELWLRQNLAQQNLVDQLRRAQIENYLAMARGTGRYAPKPAKPAGPTLGQIQTQLGKEETERQNILKQAGVAQKAGTDTSEKLIKDFDSLYGKGSAQKFLSAYTSQGGSYGNFDGSQFTADPNGPYFTPDIVTSGQTVSADSITPPVKVSDLQPFLERYKRIQAGGGQYQPPMVARALPVTQADILAQRGGNLPAAPIAQDNTGAPTPSTQDEYDALPSGSEFIDGDGQLKVKP